jgi:hypothetical protein
MTIGPEAEGCQEQAQRGVRTLLLFRGLRLFLIGRFRFAGIDPFPAPGRPSPITAQQLPLPRGPSLVRLHLDPAAFDPSVVDAGPLPVARDSDVMGAGPDDDDLDPERGRSYPRFRGRLAGHDSQEKGGRYGEGDFFHRILHPFSRRRGGESWRIIGGFPISLRGRGLFPDHQLGRVLAVFVEFDGVDVQAGDREDQGYAGDPAHVLGDVDAFSA